MPAISRRKATQCLVLAGLPAGVAVLPASFRTAIGQASQPSKAGTRVITLGTQGGPFPQAHRAQSSNLLSGERHALHHRCRNGVARRLAKGKYNIAAIGTIFLTHLHDDHTAGLGALMSAASDQNRTSPINVYVRRELTNWSRLRFNISASAPRSGSTTVERQCRCRKFSSVMTSEQVSSSKTQTSK